VVGWYVQLIQFIFVTHDGEKIVKIKVPTHESMIPLPDNMKIWQVHGKE
jgi:hypothetical protein